MPILNIPVDHIDIYRVMSAWAVFYPVGRPYDSSCSYYISTANYSKILLTRLYHIIISVGDVLGILFSSSLRCLFLLHMQLISASHIYNPPARHLLFKLGMMMECHYETMNISSIIVEAMGFGLWVGGIGLLLTSLWSKCYTGHRFRCKICGRRRGMISTHSISWIMN